MALNPRPIRPWFQINQEPPVNLLRFAGVHAILSPEPRTGFSAIENSPVHISWVPDPMPRAWLATAPRNSPDADHAISHLLQDSDPTARPTVVQLPGTWPEHGETLPIENIEREYNQISFSTQSETASVAVLTDAWHPGWTVTVDGAPATALQVAGVFRGVVLPAGKHHVLWNFEPWGWRWGQILWCIGILMGGYLRWASVRNNKQEHSSSS